MQQSLWYKLNACRTSFPESYTSLRNHWNNKLCKNNKFFLKKRYKLSIFKGI